MVSTLMASQIRRALRSVIPVAAVLGVLSAPNDPAHGQRASAQPNQAKWDAIAPGRIEPRTQEVKVVASVAGRIAEVRIRPNDKVAAGDLLVRLDDDEARARVAAAEAQVAARQRIRDDQKKKGPAALIRAEDDVADAAMGLAQAWERLDVISAPRDVTRSAVEDAAVGGARSALLRAQDQLRQRQDVLRKTKDDSGLPTREEAELAAARAELALAQVALQKTRIRAPIAGSVLQVRARVGEMAIPLPDQWLVLLGDVSGLAVRAELDQHDFAKVRVGQRVVVRAYAFPDREFEGSVRSIARYVGPGRLSGQGQRNKLTDVDVAEVVVDLNDPGPLAVGMQADAYFSAGPPEQPAMR
jgi:HlyD family secretion protein